MSSTYRLKNKAKTKKATLICIGCGQEKETTLPDIPGMPDPNTTMKIDRSLTRAGSKLGCKVGNHNYYFDYEVEYNA